MKKELIFILEIFLCQVLITALVIWKFGG